MQQMQTARQSLESDSNADSPMSGSQSTRLVKLAKESEAELGHSPEMEPFATIVVQGHRETWLLTTTGYRCWLSRKFNEVNQRIPGSQALQDALAVLIGIAQSTCQSRIYTLTRPTPGASATRRWNL